MLHVPTKICSGSYTAPPTTPENAVVIGGEKSEGDGCTCGDAGLDGSNATTGVEGAATALGSTRGAANKSRSGASIGFDDGLGGRGGTAGNMAALSDGCEGGAWATAAGGGCC